MKYKTLQEFIDKQKDDEQQKRRLADKLFHTVRSGINEEIQSVIKECSKIKLNIQEIKHDFLLEYFDSFRNSYKKPSIEITRLILSYQKTISNKAKLSFYQNVYYKGLLKEEELNELSLIIVEYNSKK